MQLKENARYDLITLSSMGIRLTPSNRQPVHTSSLFEMQATSAESNVLNISAALGLQTKILTKFVKNSPIAHFIKGQLRQRNIDFEGIDVEQQGPWGYRHQFNIADSGYGARGPYVYNDRAGEVGTTLQAEDYDLEKLFKVQGCKILHLSGLVAAISPQSSQCCLEVARYAKEQGTCISFDLNYRESFWKDRKEELKKVFHEIASLSDILIGNEEDFQLALGIKGPDAGGSDITQKIEDFKSMIGVVQKSYPNAGVYANTLREVESANKHQWGAILWMDENWQVISPRPIEILDRIGGGDGFVGGLLYGILTNKTPEQCIGFAWATGALAITMVTDYATPINEEQVWSIFEGNARVKR